MTSIRNWIGGCLLALLATTQTFAADAAAKVVMLTGQATAVGDDGAVRPLAKGDEVYSGDFVNSGPSSYVNLHFADGAFFLLRPNTRFQIEDYRYTDPAKAAAAKAAAAATAAPTPVPSPVAKTAFNAPSKQEVALACVTSQACRDCRAGAGKGSKVCNTCSVRVKNCKATKKAFLAAQQSPTTQTAATPVVPVAPAAPAGAPTTTGAPVVTATANAGSDTSRAFFRLVKGGFRSVSGLIGKANQDDYRVSTPVATIGIRGTRYGVRLCRADCVDQDEIVAKLRAAGRNAKAGETVLITTVEEGKIAIDTKTVKDFQVPGLGAKLIDANGAVTNTVDPPSTEKNDADMEPQNCGTGS